MSKARQVLWTGAAAAAVTAAAAAFLLLKEPQPEKEMQPLLFEAEAGVLNGVHAAAELSGYSGDGYVTGFDDDEDSLTVFVEAPEDGLYDMWVGYSSPGGDKYTMLSLDNRQAAEIRLAASGTFTEAYAGKWLLRTGRNEVLISRNWGWYNMDYIKIRKARKRPEHRVEHRLVNPDATPETVELLLAAMTENDPIPDPDLLVKTETHWSWFCTWNGDFINDGIQNSEDHIRHVLHHEYVLTLDEVKELRS